MNELRDKICLALDVPNIEEAKTLVSTLSDYVGYFKVGFELFTKEGPAAVQAVIDCGGKVFLDLKYHDIPNTVVGGVRNAASLGCSIMNVHATGGSEMMKAAVAIRDQQKQKPMLLAVTILTSIDESIFNNELCIDKNLSDFVVHLALLAKKSGMDGVIASPKEINIIREACGKDFFILTPGIRPVWAKKGDQRRVMTPQEAFKCGSNMVVIGRPITKAENPQKAAERILSEITY
jgi:orotidine-5'-phosphate decarboxylase